MGVKSITVVPGGSDMTQEMQRAAEKLKEDGRTPYIIPGGASNPVGATGYVACAQEMLQQLFEKGLSIDHLVVPSGSAGTHAGILTGIEGTNAGIPVSGINVSRTRQDQESLVYELAVQTAERVGAPGTVARHTVSCFDEYVGPGYSLPTREWWRLSN